MHVNNTVTPLNVARRHLLKTSFYVIGISRQFVLQLFKINHVCKNCMCDPSTLIYTFCSTQLIGTSALCHDQTLTSVQSMWLMAILKLGVKLVCRGELQVHKSEMGSVKSALYALPVMPSENLPLFILKQVTSPICTTASI